MPEAPSTEAGTVAELAAVPAVLLDDDDRLVYAIPPGWASEARDFQGFKAAPRRSRGTVEVNTGASFIQAVGDRKLGEVTPPTVYANELAHSLVAVLNDDRGEWSGWRDYRVELVLRSTPEWAHWRSRDGEFLGQEKFAQHMEDGIPELKSPSAADMLDLAQTFHATTAARFKSGRRLASGETQFVYEEEIDAKAGTAGTLAIPSELELFLAPFRGSEPVTVRAWFRYRVNRDAGLQLAYKLIRPHESEDQAFAQVVQTVQAGLPGLHFIEGSAPEERRGSA